MKSVDLRSGIPSSHDSGETFFENVLFRPSGLVVMYINRESVMKPFVRAFVPFLVL